jgi:Fur family peroxide stress response transcriptional regulator
LHHPARVGIYERVEAQILSISLGTVYKNIKTFLDTGLLREASPMRGSLRVDANTMEHQHLICTGCRAVFDLGADDLEPARPRRPLPEGFVLQCCAVEVHGLCASCPAQRDQS